MNDQSHVLVGTFASGAWVRVAGKGNFLAAPRVRSCAENELDRGPASLIIDIEEVTSVDSTFMGTLAALARQTKRACRKQLCIVGANESCKRAMHELGLGQLLSLNPEQTGWPEPVDEVRSKLSDVDAPNGEVNRGEYVLKAHKELVDVQPENEEKFKDLISMLESEQMAK